MLDQGVIAYIDDILIYSETMEEHVALVRRVMERLRMAKLCVSIKKSTFHQREVEFLGYKSAKCRRVVHAGPERSWSTKGGRGPHGPPGPT